MLGYLLPSHQIYMTYSFTPSLISDHIISELELYLVILRLCQMGLQLMILYLHFSRFFGPCWRNFLCPDTWKMVTYLQQLAGLFHKQFILQVWVKICNWGVLERSWDLLTTNNINNASFCLFDLQASTLWQYCPKYLIAYQQIFCHSKVMNAMSEQVGCLIYDDMQSAVGIKMIHLLWHKYLTINDVPLG